VFRINAGVINQLQLWLALAGLHAANSRAYIGYTKYRQYGE